MIEAGSGGHGPPVVVAVPDTAARYDWECRHVLHRQDQDLDYWQALAADTGGPILELACGTGRLTVPLAATGIDIVGLDHDPAMLRAARAAPSGARRPLWVAADMRRFALARRFALVFVAYNSLQLLTEPGDIAACLRLARRHLSPGGLVGVEVTDFQVGGADGPGAPPVLLAEAEGIRMWGTLIHHLADRTSSYLRRFEGDGWMVASCVDLRSLNGDELASSLAAAGLATCRTTASGHTIRVVAEPCGR